MSRGVLILLSVILLTSGCGDPPTSENAQAISAFAGRWERDFPGGSATATIKPSAETFDISIDVGTENGCIGIAEGRATQSGSTLIVKPADAPGCILTFALVGSSLEVTEESCNNHGMLCSFDGTMTRQASAETSNRVADHSPPTDTTTQPPAIKKPESKPAAPFSNQAANRIIEVLNSRYDEQFQNELALAGTGTPTQVQLLGTYVNESFDEAGYSAAATIQVFFKHKPPTMLMIDFVTKTLLLHPIEASGHHAAYLAILVNTGLIYPETAKLLARKE